MRNGVLVRCIYECRQDVSTYVFRELPSDTPFTVGPAAFHAGVYAIDDMQEWPDNIVKAYQSMLVRENDDKLKQLRRGAETVFAKFDKLRGT